MAGYSDLHKYLLRLVILPVSVLCAVVSITYFYLYTEEKQHYTSAHHAFISALLQPCNELLHTDPEKLRHLVESILAMDTHRAVVFKNAAGAVLAQYGKPDPRILESDFSLHNANNNSDRNYYFIEQTSPSDGTSADIAYTIIQTENFYDKLSTHQAITGVILATALCFFVLLYFARQFDLALTRPLGKIQSGIHTFLAGDYSTPIKIQRGSVYEDLVNLINNLAASHKTGQENFQENVEQTIQDLKETLESVEIQNIELDLERKNAVQANRAKSEFLTNTSHELKTPLNSIIGFTELLEKSGLSHQQFEYMKSISEAARGLSSTINDILDYSRLEIGTLTLEHKPVNVRELLEEVIQHLAAAAGTQGVRLLSIIDHDVPDNLLGDPLRVKQILSNLVSNAIKFTPEGYVLLTIGNELISDERYTLRFKVTDSGIGISSGQQDTLFDSSSRKIPGSDNQQRSSGSGLGLIIAKGLVERMNGQIEVESAEGKGSTFWFTATFAKNLALKNQQENRLASLSGLRAVVYERNTMSRMELGHYLRGWGIDVSECTRAEDLHSICHQQLPPGEKNIIVIDAESFKQEVPASELTGRVKSLSNEHEALCIVIYGVNENRLFHKEENHSYVIEHKKPLLYQNLYLNLCNRFGISLQRPLATSEEEPPEKQVLNIKVLAVDDNPANLRLVKELLKEKGITTDTADSGFDAIEHFKNTDYDLILMDVQMPELDGMATTVKLRELEHKDSRVPIVALTAHAANEKKMALLIAGMDDYISKPIHSDDLQHILDRWIKKRSSSYPTGSRAKADNPHEENDQNQNDQNKAPVSLTLSLQNAQNKPELARDMLQMLLDSLAETKTLLEKYSKQNDIVNLQEVVHKLHGGCCYCGVPELTRICARIDDNLQNSRTDTLHEDLITLHTHIDALSNWSRDIELDDLFCAK